MNPEYERFKRYEQEQEAYENQMRGRKDSREPRQAWTYNEEGQAVPIIRSRPFEKDANERPTRDRPKVQPIPVEAAHKPAKRQLIDIDENNDTLHNVDAFSKAIERAKRLKGKMEEAIGDNAWEKLHGPHEVPKKYVPPFLRGDDRPPVQRADQMDQLYELEIEDAIRNEAEAKLQSLQGARSTQGKTGGDILDMDQEELIRFAGRGGNIKEMRFIRMKIKSMVVDDNVLLQKLVGNNFSLTVALPLADVYKNVIHDQFIKLTNPMEVAANEFQFSSLSLYNFRVNEETFHDLSSSFLQVMIDDQSVHGQMPMSKLLMADNFQLVCRIPLKKTVLVEKQQKKTQDVAPQAKKGAKKGAKEDLKAKEEQKQQKIESHAGYVLIEINLQRGDTEEELERNYQLKLHQQREMQRREEELKMLEKRKRAMMLLEEQPTFAQLYLHIERVGRGGIFIDRNGEVIQTARSVNEKEQFDAQQRIIEDDQAPKEDDNTESLTWPKRNLFVSYKAFPTFEKLLSGVSWGVAEPNFNYRSQFPVLMTPDVIDRLEKFTFVIEVWDQISPDRNELVGLVKIPLAGFCYSLKTTEDDIFSLNFLAEKHNMYPMVVSDELLPIYSPRHGKNIGTLKVMLAMGTPVQVNRQIQREQDLERARESALLAQRQTAMQSKLMQSMTINNRQSTDEAALKRLLEEENRKREEEEQRKRDEDPLLAMFTPGKGNPMKERFTNALRQSMQMSNTRKDYDLRQNTHLNAMRKLFEETRTSQDLGDLNSDAMFSSDVRNHDGTVHKDEFIYRLLNTEQLTLTRTEVFFIVELMTNIITKDKPNIDIDELQQGFAAYLKYNDLIEKRIIDLLEKFKIAIMKRVETDEELLDLVEAIENRAVDSKLLISDLRIEMEKRGITIRDAIYDQLSSYFDLDHSGTIYVASFCNFFRDPSTDNFNFFKLNPSVIATHIIEYVRNCLQSKPENLDLLERELKKELTKVTAEQAKDSLAAKPSPDLAKANNNVTKAEANIPPIGDGIVNTDAATQLQPDLVDERINAKLFQVKLKRIGIVLSLWEVFSMFDYLNTQMAKVYYEPQRYHYVLYEHFYKLVTGENYRDRIKQEMDAAEQAKKEAEEKAKLEAQTVKGKRRRKRHDEKKDDLLDLAEDLNFGRDHSSDSDLLDSDRSEDDNDRDLTASQLARKRKRQKARNQNREYEQVKHTFDINVKELKNIPILTRFIREAKDFENATLMRKKPFQDSQELDESKDGTLTAKDDQTQNYIQNVSVKYSFPLDEDEILESDYIRRIAPGGKDRNGNDVDASSCYDYNVSMNTIHTYLLSKEDSIQTLLGGHQKMMTSLQSTQLFNISLALYQEGREFVIGNAQLPLEDISDLVNDFNNETNTFVASQERAVLKRVLFLYGTSYSQRENCIIGKVVVEIAYSALKQFLTAHEVKALKKHKKAGDEPTSCFMHRETFINRKIPLNALLSVFVDRVTNLKESIENIEHFAKINHNTFRPDSEESEHPTKEAVQQVDRRRILTQILKNGLNLVVLTSVFDEDEDLMLRFPDSQQQTRMLYNSLNPVFCESYQMSVQMDTKIFDYLKSKRAVFEVRHHILPYNRVKDSCSLASDIDQRCDYITLGYVRVPLLHLITKNNGIDGDFVILDEYKQKMGALKLRIALNHHNSQRPLFSGSTRLPTQVPVHDQAPSVTATNIDQLRTATLIDRAVVMNHSKTVAGGDLARQTQIGQPAESAYFLAINFVELILQDRPELIDLMSKMDQRSLSTLLFLKFKFLGNTYQTQFISLDENSYAQKGQAMQSIFMKTINMVCFEISKTVFLPIDLSDQAMVEKAFACPVEIQLWHRLTSQRPYRQPDVEKLIGSFFVELNELPRVQNTRVKGSQDHFIAYEGYYTLQDAEKGGISQDRLGMKLYLIHNEDSKTLEELDLAFHSKFRQEIESQIASKLDPFAKGYVELDDITGLIEERELDKRAAHKMVCMIHDHLEYKNSDSIFYSPLFGLPPPYFKYAKKFDNFGIIERFMRELVSLDSHQQGFVPLALFRSVLEHELRIKMEIVDDFVAACKAPQKSLDVNVLANSFQSSLDYIVLIRKLVKIIEVQDKQTKLAQTISNAPSHDLNQRLILSIDVESGMRLKNPQNELEPPNCFVKLVLPSLKGLVGDQTFETDVVRESCYPTWHSRNHSVTIPLSDENLQGICNGEKKLEFQVFHADRAIGSSRQTFLIGSAYVDISALAIDTSNDSNLISGYHYVFAREIDAIHNAKYAVGQLKITIRADNNIGECKRLNMQESKLPILSYSPTKIGTNMRADPPYYKDQIKDSLNFSHAENPFRKDATFGEGLLGKMYKAGDWEEHQILRESRYLRESADTVKASLAEKDSKLNLNLERELAEKSREELLQSHHKNMADLDKLFSDLQKTLNGQDSSFGIYQDNQIVKDRQLLESLNDQIDKQLGIVHDVVGSSESAFQRINELAMTQKTDTQRQNMKEQLHPRMEASFNPFQSKIDTEMEANAQFHESDNELERD